MTIVIPSYNDYELLRTCLESIENTASHLDYRVIVVDDFADEANGQRLQTLANDRVEVILKPEREGFAKAVNRGMSAVPTDRDIVVLNSDIVTLPGWLDALMASAYAIDPKIGMVSGRLIYPNGTIQYGGTYYARVLAPQWFGHLYVGRSPLDPVTGVGGYNRSVSGACTYVTREAFDRVGGLHEGYWLGFEDVDWGLTAWQRGIRCYYQPDALAIHHESASRGYSQGTRELASMRLFWRRWESQFLRREIATPFEVDFLVSERADAVWRRYVETVVARLGERGITAMLHDVPAELVNERVVAELEGRDSIKVCCDWGAQPTAWLASLAHGKPIYLLPGVETARYAPTAPERARIIAGYRPEFDYIASDRLTARTVTAQSAWEVQHRIVPALAPARDGAPAGPDAPVVVLGGTPAQAAAVTAVAQKHAREVVHLDDPRGSVAALDALAAAAPVAVVSFVTDATSAVPLLAMSRGAVFVGPAEEQTRYDVLDGLNAITFDKKADPAALLDGVLSDPRIVSELADNALRTAAQLYERGIADLLAAFIHAARTAV
ncbi:glycosyltransferase family 2 protein [Gryllotalpicola reticulitermitis]|uniref:Glycosyltransferase family 2 protein n=1 Tax=Gryllotalpicola reticulitermitis TaxID=1184153 RepID=A0ABV8Q581_9MICO